MSERLTRFLATRWGIMLAGFVIGFLAPLLQKLGDPLGRVTGAGLAHSSAVARAPNNVADGLVGGITPYGMGSVILGLVGCGLSASR